MLLSTPRRPRLRRKHRYQRSKMPKKMVKPRKKIHQSYPSKWSELTNLLRSNTLKIIKCSFLKTSKPTDFSNLTKDSWTEREILFTSPVWSKDRFWFLSKTSQWMFLAPKEPVLPHRVAWFGGDTDSEWRSQTMISLFAAKKFSKRKRQRRKWGKRNGRKLNICPRRIWWPMFRWA